MTLTPPDEKLIDRPGRPSGRLERLYCKKCRRELTLRTIDMVGNKIKCKKCGMLVLEIKD
jgi:DNA-directed RNA polymerase subunit RPC12/RpoP